MLASIDHPAALRVIYAIHFRYSLAGVNYLRLLPDNEQQL
jgi:hypothetical protein